jgi:hypothetical protein
MEKINNYAFAIIISQIYQQPNHLYSNEKICSDWKIFYGHLKWSGYVFIIVGIFIPLLGFLFNIHFIFDYKGTLHSRAENTAFWLFWGILLMILGVISIWRSSFYKNKISKKFLRGLLEKDPNLLTDYYQSVYDLRRTLINNNVRYHMIVSKGLKKRTEFQIDDGQFSVWLEPIYSSKYSRFLGVTVSIGPNVSKDNPEVWKIINIIEGAYTPEPRY